MKDLELIRSNLIGDESTDILQASQGISYSCASALKNGVIWKILAERSVGEALCEWKATLSKQTAKNYECGIQALVRNHLIDLKSTLQIFALINHNAVIDKIKQLPEYSECTKQARAACYISFTRFLNRRTEGMVPRAMPNREGSSKTFFKVREKVATEAMTRTQWGEFLRELQDINQRDALIAKLTLQGGKRLGEVLSLTTNMINYTQREITFKQSKTKGYEKETVITYPQQVIDELRMYIGLREGLVFVTRFLKPIIHFQLYRTFTKAGVLARIPFKVTPHVLRASTVTYLKREGFADSDIMKITGHASAQMVHAYDKSERAQNASKKISLV